MKSLRGHFLIASPHLPDPNFSRSVVLIIQHNEKGAFGLLLNRPSDSTVQEIWQQVTDDPCQNQQAVHLGGPVPGPLMALHTKEELGEDEVLHGVYFATQRDHLVEMVARGGEYRLFSGYSGWGEQQLEQELHAGGWLTLPASREMVFAPSDKVWKRVMGSVGTDILRDGLGIENLPDDPSSN